MPTVNDQLHNILMEALLKISGDEDDDELPDDIDLDMLSHFTQYDYRGDKRPHPPRMPFSLWRAGIGSTPVIHSNEKELLDWVSADMDDNEFKQFVVATNTIVGFPSSELWGCALAPKRTPMPWHIQPFQTQSGHSFCIIIFSPQ